MKPSALNADNRNRRPELDELSEEQKDARYRSTALEALNQFGLDKPQVQFLLHSDGVVYKVQCSQRNETFVLRIHNGLGTFASDLYLQRDVIESGLNWLAALNDDTELTLQTPILTKSGNFLAEVTDTELTEDVMLCSMVTWVTGDDRNRESREQAIELGRITGILHQHSMEWSPPPGFIRPQWDVEQYRSYLAQIRFIFDKGTLESDEYVLMETVYRHVEDTMNSSPKTTDSWGITHTDLGWAGNCVFHEGEGRPIDFNSCAYSYYMNNIAQIWWFVRPDYRQDFLNNYSQFVELPDDHLHQIWVFYMAEMLFRAGIWITAGATDLQPGRVPQELPHCVKDDPMFLFKAL
jgi:Ser/Thr protein kinase RdoA (MazF antagonist)